LAPASPARRSSDLAAGDNAIGSGGAGSSGAASGAARSVVAGRAGTPSRVAAPPSAVAPPGDTANVVKTGSVQVEVRRGAVASTMVGLTSLATGFNGYVADTRTAEGGDDPTGTMTLRVPAASYDDVVARVRAMGTVR